MGVFVISSSSSVSIDVKGVVSSTPHSLDVMSVVLFHIPSHWMSLVLTSFFFSLDWFSFDDAVTDLSRPTNTQNLNYTSVRWKAGGDSHTS